MDNVIRCPCCLAPDAAEIKFDRRGKPYARCTACRTMVFIGDARGLASILAAQPAIATLVRLAGGERAVQREAAAALEQAGRRTG